MRNVLVVATIALIGWMHYWAGEHVAASTELVSYQTDIAREFETLKYEPELGPEGNADLAKQWSQERRSMAQYARTMLRDGYERDSRAKLMLTTVSGWATAALALLWLGLFVSRYRIRLDRKGTQGPVVTVP